MKSFLLAILSLTVISTASNAQKRPIQKAVIQTPGVLAEVCKIKIENSLAREEGIASVKADFRKHTVTVQWYSDRTNIENIKTALANLGFDADDVTAEPSALKRLPAPCRPPVETKESGVEKQ